MEEVINSSAIGTAIPDIFIEQEGHEPEQELSAEITRLWSVHNQAEAKGKKTKEELRVIRLDLGRTLLEVRTLVSRPGRGGGFSAYVAAHSIPRATAQELIARYKKTLEPEKNCLTQPIPKTAKPTAEDLATTVWPSLKKDLTTGEAVVQFIACIAKLSGVPHGWQNEGLVIFNPVPMAVDRLSGSDSIPDPVSQPSDGGGDANTVEAVAETSVVEQVAGDDNNYAGAMA